MSICIFNVPFDHLSTEQLDTVLRGWVLGFEQKMIVTPNPEMLLAARRDPFFHAILCESHLSLPDGIGLCYAAAANGDRLRFRHTGVDTLQNLAAICEDHGRKLALFGGKPGSAQKAARVLRTQFPQLNVVGLTPGVVEQGTGGTLDVNPVSMEALQRERPDVLAVALGAKKQEQFIVENLHRLPSVKVAIGVGGALEMHAGDLRRAPDAMRRAGFEWLWRLYLEPKRAGRIWRATVVFPVTIAYDNLKQGTLVRACTSVGPEVIRQLLGR